MNTADMNTAQSTTEPYNLSLSQWQQMIFSLNFLNYQQ